MKVFKNLFFVFSFVAAPFVAFCNNPSLDGIKKSAGAITKDVGGLVVAGADSVSTAFALICFTFAFFRHYAEGAAKALLSGLAFGAAGWAVIAVLKAAGAAL